MSEEMKKCPYCGAAASIPVFRNASPAGYKTDVCTCSNDGCEVIWDWKPIEAWNNRPIEDALNKRIAELEAERDEARTMVDRLVEVGNDIVTLIKTTDEDILAGEKIWEFLVAEWKEHKNE